MGALSTTESTAQKLSMRIAAFMVSTGPVKSFSWTRRVSLESKMEGNRLDWTYWVMI